MKASKLIVLVGGILGILAFFLPLVSVQRSDFTGTVSAYQVIKGVGAAQGQVDQASVSTVADVQARDSASNGLSALKGIVIAIFVPAVFLALIGAAGVKRKKFGRVAGTFSLLFGIAGLGIATLLKSAAGGDGGIGLTLLLVTGAAGVVGGILALAKPERLAVAQSTLAAVPLAA